MTDSSDSSPPSPDAAPPSPSASAAKDSPTPAPPPSAPGPPSPGLFQRLWTLIVRLLILGMSVSLGWLAGLLVAQVWPSRNPNPPIQERVMRQTSQTVRKVRQLPQWWQGSEMAVDPVPNAAQDAAQDIALETQTSAPADAIPTPSPLSQEVVALQQDLTRLETRLADLEQQVGQTGTGDLADRLQQLAQQAATPGETEPVDNGPTEAPPDPAVPNAEPGASTNEGTSTEGTADETSPDETSPDAATSPANDGLGRHAAAPYTEPPFPLVSARIGLPSALLFEPGSSLLTPAGKQLLDAILPDLRRQVGVTFLVGSHTDGDLEAEDARQLTFQQSLAIQTYLSSQLEDTNSRWLALGYGKTRPVAVGDAPGTEARNQRIEISIVRP